MSTRNLFQTIIYFWYIASKNSQCIKKFFSKKDIFKNYQKSAKNLTSIFIFKSSLFFWNYENQKGPEVSCQFNF